MVALKALVAAVLAVVGTVSAVWQSAVSDGEITNAEWGVIVSTVIVGVLTVVGVYAARNKPTA
jgi:hypothetical protein